MESRQTVINDLANTEWVPAQQALNSILNLPERSIQAMVAVMTGNTFPGKSTQVMLEEYLGYTHPELTEQGCWNIIYDMFKRDLLNSWLCQKSFLPGLDGVCTDFLKDFNAQLVEQPCGVSSGTGKLTFSDLTGITITSSGGTSTPTKNVNDIEFSAGTIWDLKLSDGTWIPDPYTGYDISGNENHGALTDITKGIQDIGAYHQKYGFNQYIKDTSSGVAAIKSSQAYGIQEFNIYKSGTSYYLAFISDRTLAGYQEFNGYHFYFTSVNQIMLRKQTESVSSVTLMYTADSYITDNTLYRIRLVRNKTTDQYITGPVGTFAAYIKGGTFGWDDWTLISTVGGGGTNPATDNTFTTSNYCVLDNNADDLFGNAQFTDENGNVRWLPNDINKWDVVSGTFENHIVPADQGDLTKDVLGNALHYLPNGILPMGAIEFKPTLGKDILDGWDFTVGWSAISGTIDDSDSFTTTGIGGVRKNFILTVGKKYRMTIDGSITAGTLELHLYAGGLIKADILTEESFEFTAVTEGIYLRTTETATVDITRFEVVDVDETKLEIYNRHNIIGEPTEYFREEIQELESFNPTYPWRHDADEFCLDYLMTYGTETLIKRLFLKQHKTEEDLVAISNILNYNSELTDAVKTKVLKFLKDPTKTDYAAWDVYKDSSVVCAFNFKDRFSLFEEDGYLAELGWEGAEKFADGDCETNKPTINSQNIYCARGSSALSTDQAHGGSKSLKVTGDGFSDGSHYCRLETAAAMGLTVDDKIFMSFWFYIPSTNTEVVSINPFGKGIITTTDTWVYAFHVFSLIDYYNFTESYYEGITSESIYFDDFILYKIGDTVAKALDVGSGGGSDTYNNLLQSDLNKQPIRMDEGLDCIFKQIQTNSIDLTALNLSEFEVEIKLKWNGITHNSYSRIYAQSFTASLGVIAMHSDKKLIQQNGNGNFFSDNDSVPENEFFIMKYKCSISEQKEYFYINDIKVGEQARTVAPSPSAAELTIGNSDLQYAAECIIEYFIIRNL